MPETFIVHFSLTSDQVRLIAESIKSALLPFERYGRAIDARGILAKVRSDCRGMGITDSELRIAIERLASANGYNLMPEEHG